MNGTIFSDEERKALLEIFDSSLEQNFFDKKDLSGKQRDLYIKLGGDPSSQDK